MEEREGGGREEETGEREREESEREEKNQTHTYTNLQDRTVCRPASSSCTRIGEIEEKSKLIYRMYQGERERKRGGRGKKEGRDTERDPEKGREGERRKMEVYVHVQTYHGYMTVRRLAREREEISRE